MIYIFLSGGLAQHESFDPKPDAPDGIRGEFGTIATKTPGVRITEHLPTLAACSDKWAMVRSLTHKSNDHSLGHHIMLTGRSDTPPGFNPSAPTPTDHPSIAAIAGAVTRMRNNLPPAIVLPDRIVHNTGRVIPGQFAGVMGRSRDPWFIEASRLRAASVRRVSRVRVRPPGTEVRSAAEGIRRPEPEPARGRGRRAIRRPARHP